VTSHYWLGVRDAPVLHLKMNLELTQQPNWGYALRRGLLELSEHDFDLIAGDMRLPTRETL
jgi:hypothetical protein